MPGARPRTGHRQIRRVKYPTNSGSELALEAADVLLRVQIKADPLDDMLLGLEEVDVVLLVLHQALEQVA